jgi:hypothetical protein
VGYTGRVSVLTQQRDLLVERLYVMKTLTDDQLRCVCDSCSGGATVNMGVGHEGDGADRMHCSDATVHATVLKLIFSEISGWTVAHPSHPVAPPWSHGSPIHEEKNTGRERKVAVEHGGGVRYEWCDEAAPIDGYHRRQRQQSELGQLGCRGWRWIPRWRA